MVGHEKPDIVGLVRQATEQVWGPSFVCGVRQRGASVGWRLFTPGGDLVIEATGMGGTFPGQRPNGGWSFHDRPQPADRSGALPKPDTFTIRGNQLSQVVGVAQPMLVQQFAVRFASVVNQGAKKPHQNTESVENCCPGSDGA